MNKRNVALFSLSLLATTGMIVSAAFMSSKRLFANLFAVLPDEETSVDLVDSLKGKSLDGEGKVSFERNGYEFVFQGENVNFGASSITINAGGYLRNETCFNGLHDINYSASGAFKVMTGSASDKIITKHESFALSSGTSVAVDGGEHFMIAAEGSSVTLSSLSLDFTCSTTGKAADPDDRWDATWTWSLAGVGSETDPYLISTKAEWDAFTTEASANLFRGRHFKLGADIGTELDPVTTFVNNTTSYVFSGHFDGNNHEMRINLPGRTNGGNTGRSGLFAFVGNGASFKDLTLRGSVNAGSYTIAAALAACLNTGSASFDGIINYASVAALDTAAGVVASIYGGNNSTTITNCENHGELSVSKFYIGGIVGNNDGSEVTISNCLNDANFSFAKRDGVSTAFEANIGGIAGKSSKGTISNCKNFGNIVSNEQYGTRIGGIVGKFGGTMQNCVYGYTPEEILAGKTQATMSVKGNYNGGIVGGIDTAGSTITGCKNYVTLSNLQSGYGSLAGICGLANVNASIVSCENHGDVTATRNAGGIVGRVAGSKVVNITNCLNDGVIQIGETVASANIGGTGNPSTTPGLIVGSNGGTANITNE